MIRKQVYIEQRQERLLKRRARELRVTQAELIRRGIDQIGRLQALSPNRESWREAKLLIGERMKMRVRQTRRTWRRDDLYEQRLGPTASRH